MLFMTRHHHSWSMWNWMAGRMNGSWTTPMIWRIRTTTHLSHRSGMTWNYWNRKMFQLYCPPPSEWNLQQQQQQGSANCEGLHDPGAEHAWGAAYQAPVLGTEGMDVPGMVHACPTQGQRAHGAQDGRMPGGCIAWTTFSQCN